MDNENGVQVIVEEPNPYHLTSKRKARITCWDTWVSLCKDESVKERITELFMNFNEKRDLLEITGFKNLRKLVIQDRSSQLIREIMIHGLNNLTEVSIKDYCFNERIKSVNSNFMVFHCPKLRKIKVGKGSLCRLKSCFIDENPSLETIRWGDGSFMGCESFYLKKNGEKKTSLNGTDFRYGEEQKPVILKLYEECTVLTISHKKKEKKEE